MRITQKMLDQKVDCLNEITKSPAEPYTQGKGANAGNYHIDYAYGGVSLHRISNGGGSNDVFNCGHVPKRELYYRIASYIDGIILATGR